MVLFIADLFHPVHGLSVELFLNGDVRHRRRGRRAGPLAEGREPFRLISIRFLLETDATIVMEPKSALLHDELCLLSACRSVEWNHSCSRR